MNIKGYGAGFRDGFDAAEKRIAALESQLAAAIARGDEACDRLLAIYGARAISAPGKESEERKFEAEAALAKIVTRDNFEDLPIGHPDATFRDERELEIIEDA